MIIVDSNVISEALRLHPDTAVAKWMSQQSEARLFTTAVTEAEIRYGVARLDPGRRKDSLDAAVDRIFNDYLAGRVLPFDRAAAADYAAIVSTRNRAGSPISQFDAQIAAIARSRGASVATRNVRDFESCGIEILNPWNFREPS